MGQGIVERCLLMGNWTKEKEDEPLYLPASPFLTSCSPPAPSPPFVYRFSGCIYLP